MTLGDWIGVAFGAIVVIALFATINRGGKHRR